MNENTTRDPQTLTRMYEIMTTIKQCDEKMRSLLMSGQIMLIWYSPARPGGRRRRRRRRPSAPTTTW